MERSDLESGRQTGSASPEETELFKEEEPDTRGTVFLTGLLLIFIFGFWVMMYLELIDR